MVIPLVICNPRLQQLPKLPVGSNGYTLGFRQLPQLPVGSDGYTPVVNRFQQLYPSCQVPTVITQLSVGSDGYTPDVRSLVAYIVKHKLPCSMGYISRNWSAAI